MGSITMKMLILFMFNNMGETPTTFIDNDETQAEMVEVVNKLVPKEFEGVIFVKDRRMILVFHTGASASVPLDCDQKSLDEMIGVCYQLYMVKHPFELLTMEEFKTKVLLVEAEKK